MSLKPLHTSDAQLGAPLTAMGEGGRVLRDQPRKTFSRIVELSSSGGYDMLLVAGDLFTSNCSPLVGRTLISGQPNDVSVNPGFS